MRSTTIAIQYGASSPLENVLGKSDEGNRYGLLGTNRDGIFVHRCYIKLGGCEFIRTHS